MNEQLTDVMAEDVNTAENIDTTAVDVDTPDVDEGNSQPTEQDGSTPKADEGKSSQTPEQDNHFAELRRKEQLEKVKQEKEQLEAANRQIFNMLDAAGITGTPEEQLKLFNNMLVEYRAETNGQPVEVARADMARLSAEQQLAVIKQSAANIAVQTQLDLDRAELERLKPNALADFSETEFKRFVALRQADCTATDAYILLKGKQTQAKKDHGTGHLKNIGGNGVGGVDIPASVLKDYLDMGVSKEDAIKDYQRIMKGK